MVKESLQLSLQNFTWIINNYAYSGRLLLAGAPVPRRV